MVEELFSFSNIVAFFTLAGLEIVLGIDNVVFITILTGKLDHPVRRKAQQLGLLAAMAMRIVLLLAISWVMGLTQPLVDLWGLHLSGKDFILLGGGLFLVAKATYEIHDKLEVENEHAPAARATKSFSGVIFQIMMIDIVFSLDSVITAVGMAQSIVIMIAAVVVAVLVMMVAAGTIGGFVEKHPTLKMLALAFLILIGVMLVAEGFHQHINKGYIYFAMAFSLAVELLNIRIRKSHPVVLHEPHMPKQA